MHAAQPSVFATSRTAMINKVHNAVVADLLITVSTPAVCLYFTCRADIMEALPSKADPAVAGGPVSLPSQAAVLHGVRASDYHSRSTYGDRERKRDRDSERHHSDKPKAAPVVQIPNKTETPKERLKRMMAAQINKQVAKDSVKSAQKIAHEEKERKARVQIERMQYTGGRRSRSPSPERYRSRSRSPSHERRSSAPHFSRY